MRRHHELDVDDDDRVVRDGESVRVPMYLMDGVQRAVAGVPPRRDVLVTDGRGLPAGHRPGYVFIYAADSADDPRVAAFAERGRYLTDAWRTPVCDVARIATEAEEEAIRRGDDPGGGGEHPEVPADDAERQAWKARLSNSWRSPPTWPTNFSPAVVEQAAAIAKVLQLSPPIRHSTGANAAAYPADADPRMAALADRDQQLQDAWRAR
jgi:hypothetical protein